MYHTSLIRTAARWKIPRGLALEVLSRDQFCVYCSGPFSEDFYGPRTGHRSWEYISNDVLLVSIDRQHPTLLHWLQFERWHQVVGFLAPVQILSSTIN